MALSRFAASMKLKHAIFHLAKEYKDLDTKADAIHSNNMLNPEQKEDLEPLYKRMKNLRLSMVFLKELYEGYYKETSHYSLRDAVTSARKT